MTLCFLFGTWDFDWQMFLAGLLLFAMPGALTYVLYSLWGTGAGGWGWGWLWRDLWKMSTDAVQRLRHRRAG